MPEPVELQGMEPRLLRVCWSDRISYGLLAHVRRRRAQAEHLQAVATKRLAPSSLAFKAGDTAENTRGN